MRDDADKLLDGRLTALPLEIEPPAGLWPEIAREIARPSRRTRPWVYAAAAAVVLVVCSSALTWALLRARQTGFERPLTAAQSPQPNFVDPTSPALPAARADLETTFRERLELLDPATRAQIKASLAVIHKAHDDIADALAGTPGSPVLEQLLASTWHDEFDLYDDVVRSTQPTLARN